MSEQSGVEVRDYAVLTESAKLYDVEVVGGAELNDLDWRRLHTLAHDAIGSALHSSRSQAEIDTYIGWPDTERFARSRIDPNTEVGELGSWPDDGKIFSPGQSFWNPRLAIASRNGKIVGFASGADNTSGSRQWIRTAKHYFPPYNYFAYRDIYVQEGHRQHGVAPKLGRALLETVAAVSPVTAHTYPEELTDTEEMLLHAGMYPSHEETVMVAVFGEGTRKARLVRHEARTALGVRRRTRMFAA